VIEGQEVAMATSSVISFFPVRSLFLRHKETAVQHALVIPKTRITKMGKHGSTGNGTLAMSAHAYQAKQNASRR